MNIMLGILAIAIVYFMLERILPGRKLPHTSNWYLRAIFLNICQFGIIMLAGISWDKWLQGASLFHISEHLDPIYQGLLAWFLGTFIFYWWHRVRHTSQFLWVTLHQIHHSASRIEILTSFYKHPFEMAANSIMISAVLFTMLGANLEAAGWFNLIAATGELFYHANIKTPHWIGYFMQRPEHHSIHHQYRLHNYNHGDITWWDRLFGTFKDTIDFSERCGFDEGKEEQLAPMLVFQDVNPRKAKSVS